MKIICNSALLTEGINIVSKAVSGKTTLPILECILLTASAEYGGGIKLMGTDLEIGVETKTIEAEVVTEGSVALNAGIFSDIARKLPGLDAYIEKLDNNVVIIKSGGSEFKILGFSADEFPSLPAVEKEVGFSIQSSELKSMIKQTLFSVSADESRPVMTGELFSMNEGVLKITAVDGFRIAVRTYAVDNRTERLYAVVPGKTLNEMLKILPQGEKSVTDAYFSDRYALFETDDAVIVSRLIEGRFIEFENIFSTEGTTFATVERQEFLSGLERASLIAREAKKTPVKLSFDGDRLRISSNTESGTFFEEMPLELDGMEIDISFNPKYLIDILKVMEDEKIRLEFTTPLSPCVIKGTEHDEYRFITLPLRPKA